MSEQERSHWRQWMNDMERWATMKSPIPAQGVRKLLEYMHDLEDLVADNVTLTDATLGGKSETLLNIVKARVSERRKA
jgi:hypothetical protein